MLFGVAGGMAEWMDLDPAVVRIVWALLVLAGGVGLLLYIVAAIVIPESPFATAPGMAGATGDPTAAASPAEQAEWEARRARRAARRSSNAPMLFGVILIIAGAWFLIERYLPAFDTSWFVPGVLIVVGVALLFGAMNRSRNPDGG